MYDIYIDYMTGNSFGSETEVDEPLEIPTKSLDIAKKNLVRIEEHTKKYKDNHTYPDEMYSLEILTDTGTRKIPCFWLGYFEELLRARIKPNNEGMSFEA